MFRPTYGHSRVQNWSVKHTEEEMHIKQGHKKQL